MLFHAKVDHGELNNFRQRQTIRNGRMARQTVNMTDSIEIPTVNHLRFDHGVWRGRKKLPKSASRNIALLCEMIINISVKTAVLPFQF